MSLPPTIAGMPNPATSDFVTDDFNAALRDYFIWKATVAVPAPPLCALTPNKENESSGGGGGGGGGAAAAASSNGNDRIKNTNSAEKNEDGKLPAKGSDDQDRENSDSSVAGTVPNSAKYQQLANLMNELFPNLRPPLVPLQVGSSTAVPHAFSRYTLFTPLYKAVVSLRQRNQALELQVSQLQALQAPYTAVARGKRKDPPIPVAPPVDRTIPAQPCPLPENQSTTLPESTPPAKRPRTSTGSTQRKIVGRKDVPEDVQELITVIRKDLSKQKRKNKGLNERLEKAQAEKAKAEAEKAIAEVEAEKANAEPPLIQQPQKPRAKIESTKPWEERIKELEHFAKGNGHCRVRTRGVGLGRWVMAVRKNYKVLQNMSEEERSLHYEFKKNYGANDLNPERIQQLNDMGFEWCLVSKAPTPWETRYQQLVEYKEKHGNLNVPRSYPEHSLGEFVHTVRKDYKRKAPVLMGERAEQLEALGFVWDVTGTNPTFEDRLEECRDFRRKHGHLSVPGKPRKAEVEEFNKLPYKERSFRCWVHRTREYYRDFVAGRKSRIDKTRIRQLEELGFDFDMGLVRKSKKYQQENSETQSDEQGFI